MGKGSAVRGAIRRTREAYSVFAAHRATSLAGMLVFFLIMSLVPFLFWLTLIFGDAEGLFEKVLALELFGWARELILFLRDNAQGATAGAGIVLFATTLWSSSAFFYHLRRSGEIVYDRTHEKGWRVRVLAILMTFAVLLFFSAAGGLFAFLAFAVRALHPAVRYASVYSAALLFAFLPRGCSISTSAHIRIRQGGLPSAASSRRSPGSRRRHCSASISPSPTRKSYTARSRSSSSFSSGCIG